MVRGRLAWAFAGATLVVGVGLVVFAGPTWALGIGALLLVAPRHRSLNITGPAHTIRPVLAVDSGLAVDC